MTPRRIGAATLITLGLVVGCANQAERPLEDRIASESTTIERAGLTDSEIARKAEAYMKESWMIPPDEPWWSFDCTEGITCWHPYIMGFAFADGVLRPTLQVDRITDEYLGEKAAENMASFIGFADEPWAREIRWVEVVDGAGVPIAQKSVTRR